jgi:hypothetical protein
MRRPMEVLNGCRLSLALLLAAPLAWSHGAGNDDVIVTMDAVPAALDAIRVELRKTLAPQLVMENSTGIPVEVIGSDGITFLRLGPAGALNDAALHMAGATRGTATGSRQAAANFLAHPVRDAHRHSRTLRRGARHHAMDSQPAGARCRQ